jgi:hypothetical protein
MMPESERVQVLKMVEAGKINAAEGARLLGAVGQPSAQSDWSGRWLRVRVTNLSTRQPRVTVNLPIAWIMLGLQIGARYHPELAQIDVNEVLEAIRTGAEGRIVEVENEEEGERIEVYVD